MVDWADDGTVESPVGVSLRNALVGAVMALGSALAAMTMPLAAQDGVQDGQEAQESQEGQNTEAAAEGKRALFGIPEEALEWEGVPLPGRPGAGEEDAERPEWRPAFLLLPEEPGVPDENRLIPQDVSAPATGVSAAFARRSRRIERSCMAASDRAAADARTDGPRALLGSLLHR